jgi:ammonia channel protein AmtB
VARSKNALAVMMQSFLTITIVSVTWTLVGSCLTFGHVAFVGLVDCLDMAGLADTEVAVQGMHTTELEHVRSVRRRARVRLPTPLRQGRGPPAEPRRTVTPSS